MQIPSRNSNPFASCWTRPGALSYLTNTNDTLERLVERLAAHKWRGEIIGPHGAGKSTLLYALEPLLAAVGRQWVRVDIHDRTPHAEWRQVCLTNLNAHTLLVIDGYEQLTRFTQRRLRCRCWRTGAGLLITSHTKTGFPTLHDGQPSALVALELFRRLTRERSTPIAEAEVMAAFNACKGNLRQLFFDLYDLHERRVRSARSEPSAAAVRSATG